jgi:hypothetical protein
MRHTFFQVGNVFFRITSDGERIISVVYKFVNDNTSYTVDNLRYYELTDLRNVPHWFKNIQTLTFLFENN